MKRNPDAMCGNCPMWSATDDSEWGVCRKESPLAELGEEYSRNYAIWPETKRGAWCGEHPDFAAPEPVVKKPTCMTCQNYGIDERDQEWCDLFGVELEASQTMRGLVCAMWLKRESDQ